MEDLCVNMFNLDPVTIVSTSFIIGVAIYFYIRIRSYSRKDELLQNNRWIDQYPSIVSTLGVLGTFIGITKGLLSFNTEDLDNSIPELLDGLKTAFLTSLAGMIGSLLLSRTVSKRFDAKDNGVSDINVAAGEICQAVQKMSGALSATINVLVVNINNQTNQQNAFFNTVTTIMNSQKSNVEALANSINGLLVQSQAQTVSLEAVEREAQQHTVILSNIQEVSEENKAFAVRTTSYISNVEKRIEEILDHTDALVSIEDGVLEEVKTFGQKLHGEVVEIEDKMESTNKMLTEKFNEFSDLLKKSNTEALVEVMKRVTEEFQKQMNDLISKLVQENFDQLNKSVEKLNQWQMENKEMILMLTEKYKDMADKFEGTSTTLRKVEVDTKNLVSDGGKLRQLINMLNKVVIEDKQFVEISKHLTETVTLTKDNMKMFDQSTRVLNDWVRKQRNFVDGVTLLIQKLDELNKIRDYNETFWKDTKHRLEEGVGYIAAGSKTLQTQLKELDKQFYARLSATLAELDTCIQAMISQNTNRK